MVDGCLYIICLVDSLNEFETDLLLFGEMHLECVQNVWITIYWSLIISLIESDFPKWLSCDNKHWLTNKQKSKNSSFQSFRTGNCL